MKNKMPVSVGILQLPPHLSGEMKCCLGNVRDFFNAQVVSTLGDVLTWCFQELNMHFASL